MIEGRRLDILNEVAGGKIWLEVGWIDVKGIRIRRHSRTSVRLERFIKQLKELDRRVKGRIIYGGSLRFLINSEAKNEIIKRNLWGAREYREYFFGKNEDKDEVMRFCFPVMLRKRRMTLKGLIRKLEVLINLNLKT